jgi:hypothetical protein
VAALALDHGRIDDGGASRLDAYVAHVAPGGPVLVIGLGDGGELLRALREAGIDAIGIDPGEANVAVCDSIGLPVAMDDPLRNLAALEARQLAGLVVASGVADRFDADQWLVFADLAGTRLRPDGRLIVEMLNVASPLGLALRMRDPTLPPPVHVDTVGFLLRVAGLESAEVRSFGAFREVPTLPVGEVGTPGSAELEQVSRLVNRFLIGQPLAAVVARR